MSRLVVLALLAVIAYIVWRREPTATATLDPFVAPWGDL